MIVYSTSFDTSTSIVFIVCFQGDPGVPGFKGEAGPKGEPVSLEIYYLGNILYSMILSMLTQKGILLFSMGLTP